MHPTPAEEALWQKYEIQVVIQMQDGLKRTF